MKLTHTSLPGVMLIETDCFADDRGYFKETWNRQRYHEIGFNEAFVQDNFSFSKANVLRGLHFQNPRGQGKLVSSVQGEIFDVAVDIRPASPHYKQWVGAILNDKNHHQLYIPPGFAHGFCVITDTAMVSYKCTTHYFSQTEYCLRWNDPQIGIEWPISHPILSDKDAEGYLLENLPADSIPSVS